MDDDAKELMKVGAEAAMKPFASLMDKLFGGVAEQIGGSWEDRAKMRRAVNFLKGMKKLHATIETLHIPAQPIADNIWIPAVEAMSLTSDETLQIGWANLLANAADPIGAPVRAIFTSFLRDLGTREVVFLDGMWGHAKSRATNSPHNQPSQVIYKLEDLQDNYVAFGLSKVRRLHSIELSEQNDPELPKESERFWMMLDIIQRHNIIRDATVEGKQLKGQVSARERDQIVRRYHFSDLGFAFVRACRPPERR
jgi:hypothetical protein